LDGIILLDQGVINQLQWQFHYVSSNRPCNKELSTDDGTTTPSGSPKFFEFTEAAFAEVGLPGEKGEST